MGNGEVGGGITRVNYPVALISLFLIRNFKIFAMKHIKNLIFCCLLFAGVLLSFAPNSGKGFSYQAVARGSDGQVKAKENVEVQFTLLPGPQAATPVWQETHSVATNEFGLFSLVIGRGSKSGGTASTFTDVDFSIAEFWLKVEIKDKGVWQEISETQLLSVPYAEVAGNAQPAPTGSIMAFAGPKDKVPAGWLLCDGAPLSRSNFAPLYAVIGTAWGAGDGASTFHIPDLRGLFLRGVSYDQPKNWDDGRNNRTAINSGGNTNNEVGSFQGESFRGHNHGGNTVANGAHNHRVMNGNSHLVWQHESRYDDVRGWSPNVIDAAHGTNVPLGGGIYGETNGNHQHGIPSDGGNETRPDNAYVNYIIKL